MALLEQAVNNHPFDCSMKHLTVLCLIHLPAPTADDDVGEPAARLSPAAVSADAAAAGALGPADADEVAVRPAAGLPARLPV